MSRQRVVAKIEIYFTGDYYATEEIPDAVRGWINEALRDRPGVDDWNHDSIAVVPDTGLDRADSILRKAVADLRTEAGLREAEGQDTLAEYARELADLIDPQAGSPDPEVAS